MFDSSQPLDLSWPQRVGDRPRVTDCAPQEQLDQLQPSHRSELLRRLGELPGVRFADSARAPWGSVGLYLEGAVRPGHEAFLIGNEFAHVHPGEDGSLHLVLPEPLRTRAIEAGWAQPHPLAGHPSISADTVLVYAPRDAGELEVIVSMVCASWRNAVEALSHSSVH